MTPNVLHLNARGEIIEVNEADQFQPNTSQFACGYYACAVARTMNRPGQAPTQGSQQIIAQAEQWYAQYNGDDSASNEAGMTTEQEYELLQQIGLHYQAIATDIDQVKAWVQKGYPVLLSVMETSVYDLTLGANPYPWTPTGNHMILVTGVTANGNLLVRDSANCTSLNNPQSLRPGPRTYRPSLNLVSATVIVPPWRPRPASTTPPAAILEIPTGWSDDGTTLMAPNNIRVVLGFRSYVLKNQWNPANLPLAPENTSNPVEFGNPQSGSGSRQIFLQTELGYTQSHGVYEIPLGQELWAVLQKLTAPAPAPASGGGPAITSLKAREAISPAGETVADLRAAARLVSDISSHMLVQLNNLQQMR